MNLGKGGEEITTYEDLKASDELHQMHSFGHPLMQKGPRQLVVFEFGEGAVLKDVNGKEYLDAMAGITVAHLGHGRKDLAQVAFEQVCQPFPSYVITTNIAHHEDVQTESLLQPTQPH